METVNYSFFKWLCGKKYINYSSILIHFKKEHADIDSNYYHKSILQGGRRKRGRPKKGILDEEEKKKAEDQEFIQDYIRKVLKEKDIKFFTQLEVIGGPSDPLEWYFKGSKHWPIRKISEIYSKIEEKLSEKN